MSRRARSSRRAAPLVLAMTILTGCHSSAPSEPESRPVSSARAAPPPAPGAAPRFIEAPPGEDVAAFVRAELTRAEEARATVVVYVGAKWCEPCERFHRALAAGELDRELRGVRFIGYDLDRSGELLAEAGYESPMIPLFCLPDAEGRGTSRRMAGSIKGPGAVGELLPRLTALLAEAPAR
ncbi:MAG: thioredoxin family protein [Sorangiineae bacterium]|nr:thioredoxin family protein [Polyangiaceae bacterium]MEB2323251.1 thioredoxin family protein [Sorangiineae bacterium]